MPRRLPRPAFVLAVVLVAAAGVARPAAPAADESARFFAGPVPHFRITVEGADLKQLRQDARKYVHATARDQDREYRDVGLHLKGAAGSFRNFDDKPALTLNFDKFAKGRLYHGIDKLHLNNSVQDPTYLTEIICGGLFLEAGVPTARGTHAFVELNGRPRGLYVLKEGYDRTFLKHHFKNTSGNLYDGGFLADIDRDIRKSSGAEPTPERAELKALAAACREPDLAKRAERVTKLLDVDRFLTLAALEVLTWHWDGYCMKANNYRVYHDPDSGKVTIIPHGMDQMFWEPDGTIEPPSGGLISRRLFQVPAMRARYYERLAELRRTVFLPDRIGRRIDELVARLKPELEKLNRNAARDFAAHAEQLKAQVRRRAESVDRQLAARAKK
jgi:hypothetical protein